ncbi:hypothetical protein FB451DRAFT_1409826 [Mycena latifolia]|nr:hypothetical protein FB451DRAFT_1409826 [Mycena latifolia]
MRAYISIEAHQYFPPLPENLYPILWPPAWAWITFLDTHPQCLAESESGQDAKHASRVQFLSTIRTFRSHPETGELVASTRGIWTMVAGVWTDCVERNLFVADFDFAAFVLGQFLSDPAAATHVDELIEALGGTQLDLVAVAMKHIRLIACRPGHSMTAPQLIYLFPVLTFLDGVTALVSPEAFFAAGMVDTLVDGAYVLRGLRNPRATELIGMCLRPLCWAMADAPRRIGMASALKSGLLRATMTCAEFLGGLAAPDLSALLRGAISYSLVYHSVLRRVPNVLQDVVLPKMGNSLILEAWRPFTALASARLAVFKSFDSGNYPSLRACDNMKASYERLLFYVGSPSYTNNASVRTGGKESIVTSVDNSQMIVSVSPVLPHIAGLLLTTPKAHPEDLGRRELSFLCVLLHHDYEQQKHEVWLQQIGFMHSHPSTDIYTIFDYTQGPSVQITVHPVSSPPDDLLRRFQFRIGQARASTGRLELHYMRIWDPFTDSCGRWIPLRSGGAAVSQGLRTIASEIGADADISALRDHILEQVRTLETTHADVLQIH